MGFAAFLLVSVLVAYGCGGLINGDLENRDWEMSPRGRECSFCEFYAEKGWGPYEMLWKIGSEIWRGLTLQQLSLMLMNPEQLRIAELIFQDYCDQICNTNLIHGKPCNSENSYEDYDN